MSWQLALLDLYLRLVEKRYMARETDFPRARARMETGAAALPLPPGTRPEPVSLGGVPAQRLAGAPLVFWIHGGAYCLGSPRTHLGLAASLAQRIGAGAVLPDYRLAPEHRFPAAYEDVRASWDALEAEGLAAGGIVLGGDSAGGGLAFALLQALIAEGRPLPAAVLGFSPWVDLTESGESLRTLARREALLPVRRFGEIRDLYLGGADARDPRASPIFAHFRGAPPVLILSSRAEVLRDDARMLAARLREGGVAVTHEEWPRVPHAWPVFEGRLPEADRALDLAAAFARAALETATAKRRRS